MSREIMSSMAAQCRIGRIGRARCSTTWTAFVGGFAVAGIAVSCASPAPPPAQPTDRGEGSAIRLPPVPPGESDADGEDDGVASVEPGPGLRALLAAPRAEFRREPAPPGAHPLVCDLTPFAGVLYVASSVAPIDLDGARIYRFDPAGPEGARWTLAFDWDRGGAPGVTHEQGGQGIARVRAIDGALFATDADAPRYGGFGLSDAPFEGYVFVSDDRGAFGALAPEQRPPAGTRVLPLAFHAFDVIRYRGALIATGGTVEPNTRWGRFPGGLFVGSPSDRELAPRFVVGRRRGVVRTTYMHRFRGRLYIGFQNNERRARWDLAVLAGDPRAPDTAEPVLARVTADGGWLTRRFASGDGVLYWIASGYRNDGRGAAVFASADGARFARVSLPDGAGDPQDMAIVDGARFLLTTTGLYRARAGDDGFSRVADAPAGDPFGRFDPFCSAPLVAFDDTLYAGSTRDGALYRIDAAAE